MPFPVLCCRRRLFHYQLGNLSLFDLQIRLRFEHLSHLQTVCLLIALRTRRPDSRPARGIEQPELNTHSISNLAHNAAQCVHLTDEVALRDSSDGRIARHLRDQIYIQGVQGSFQTHSRAGDRSLAPGVPSANHNDLELFGELHEFHSNACSQYGLTQGA